MIDKQIISNGVDIVKVSRIEKIINGKHKSLFLKKIFTEKEIDYFESTMFSPQSISGYFAAKEATMKAIGKGMNKIKFKDIEIIKDSENKPFIKLHGNAKIVMKENNIHDFKLSISHEKEYAIAFVIAVSTNKA